MAEWESLRDEVRRFLAEGKLFKAGRAVADLHPADLAHLMEGLGEGEKRDLFTVLPAKVAAEVVAELSDYSREQVLAGILTPRLAEIVDDMPSDDAADLVAELPREQASEVLKRIDHEDSVEVRTLLQYDEDTAGGIMQLELVAVRSDQRVSEVIEEIRRRKDEVGEIHYVFVVDPRRKLLGMLSLSRLILAAPATRAGELVEECPLVIAAHEDQESVAHKFRHYDVVSAPVVDGEGRLLGRITIDDVVEILEEEAREDMARMAGFSPEDEVFYSRNVFKISRLRLPWLVSNMFGGLVTGWLLWLFQVRLTDAVFLISFVPVINAMAGNMGVQSSTIMVRGFAVGRVNYANLFSMLCKEVRVALLMGLVCGGGVGLVAYLWEGAGHVMIGLVVGLAMTGAISNAAILGTLAPALFKKLKVDPAISSGPVVSTLNDITGTLIYFAISTFFYRHLVA